MGSYIPATGEERQRMLEAVGLSSMDDLFSVVPALLERLSAAEKEGE